MRPAAIEPAGRTSRRRWRQLCWRMNCWAGACWRNFRRWRRSLSAASSRVLGLGDAALKDHAAGGRQGVYEEFLVSFAIPVASAPENGHGAPGKSGAFRPGTAPITSLRLPRAGPSPSPHQVSMAEHGARNPPTGWPGCWGALCYPPRPPSILICVWFNDWWPPPGPVPTKKPCGLMENP
jgi:hypothetical protein